MREHRSPAGINKAWLILGTVLLSLAAVVGFNLRLDHERVEAREQERLLAQAKVVQLILDEQFTSLYHVLGALSLDWAAQGKARDFNTRLATLAESMPGVRTIFIMDAQGTIQATSRPELSGKNFSHRAYFTAIRKAPALDMLYVSPPFLSSLGTFTINLGRMIAGPRGEFNGIVTAALEPKYFTPLMGSILYAPDMWVHIIHGEGSIFLSVPEREGVPGKNLAQKGTFFSQHMASDRDSSIFTGRALSTGEDRMLVISTIRPPGLRMDVPLVLGVARDVNAVYALWRSDAQWQVGLLLAVSVLSCVGLHIVERRKKEYERQKMLADKALADSERFMRTITENIPGMVGYWGADLRCGYANGAYVEWFGRSRQELLGTHIKSLLGGELYSKNEPYILGALAGQPQLFERTIVRPDGRTGHTLVHYIPDLVDEGVRGFFVLVTDITELKTAQLELENRVEERTEELRQTVLALREAMTQAESASRMKSEFLANLSHELRTPLNPIVALTGLVLDTELTAEQRDYLEDVRQAAQKLLQLFNRLLELMELERYVPVQGPIALQSLLDIALQGGAVPAGKKGLRLLSSMAADLPEVIWSDLNLLRMALLELVDNAVRFTSEGEVSIALTRVDEVAGERLCISVRDTGMGIPAERLADISTGLTQADSHLDKRFAGLGVGMAKTRKAAALLGGHLEVESALDRGSTFRILLPLQRADAALDTSQAAPAA